MNGTRARRKRVLEDTKVRKTISSVHDGGIEFLNDSYSTCSCLEIILG